MTELDKLKIRLAKVTDLGELAKLSGMNPRHLQRLRDGAVCNPTLASMEAIKAGLRSLPASLKARKQKEAA